MRARRLTTSTTKPVKNSQKRNHSLPYSFVGIQTLILATNYPSVFWNCSCLIINSGGLDEEDMEDNDDEEDEDEKIKNSSVNYGRMATAISTMKQAGVLTSPPDINKSKFTFSPDLENNSILFGIKGINKVGSAIVQQILQNRPYGGIEDFLSKVSLNKPQMINLIKSGAFDSFGPRDQVMKVYAELISDKKKRITLQNVQMLIGYDLIPKEFEFQKKLFNFNKHIKKIKDSLVYFLDEAAIKFYEQNYDMDLVKFDDRAAAYIEKTIWDKIYKKGMKILSDEFKKNQQFYLDKLNEKLIEEVWNKYCTGSISKWEMDSIMFYYHEHELEGIDEEGFDIVDFFSLPEEPVLDKVIYIRGKEIPLYKLSRIAGTVIDKNKNKNTVTLLTKGGVVQVKIFGQVYSHYDKQISEIGVDGKKKVLEKSMFTKGNKLVINGVRQGEQFLAKKYKSTPYHLVELITYVDPADGYIETYCRVKEED